MRKVKLQIQMTIDGYLSGLRGEMDWIARLQDRLRKGTGLD